MSKGISIPQNTCTQRNGNGLNGREWKKTKNWCRQPADSSYTSHRDSNCRRQRQISPNGRWVSPRTIRNQENNTRAVVMATAWLWERVWEVLSLLSLSLTLGDKRRREFVRSSEQPPNSERICILLSLMLREEGTAPIAAVSFFYKTK